jgi:hypothetical protein
VLASTIVRVPDGWPQAYWVERLVALFGKLIYTRLQGFLVVDSSRDSIIRQVTCIVQSSMTPQR